jgi:hypothetical protein
MPGGPGGFAERVIKGMKVGGPVKKTGLYRLHKGEFVMPATMVNKIAKGKDGKKK